MWRRRLIAEANPVPFLRLLPVLAQGCCFNHRPGLPYLKKCVGVFCMVLHRRQHGAVPTLRRLAGTSLADRASASVVSARGPPPLTQKSLEIRDMPVSMGWQNIVLPTYRDVP
jgi:hypothetical protein